MSQELISGKIPGSPAQKNEACRGFSDHWNYLS